MFSLREIVRQNQNTYYDFSTNKSLSAWPRYLLMLIMGFLLAWLFPNLSKDLTNAVITVYAILIGFSFNVLFYLLSTNKMKIHVGNESLEREIKIEKINKIGDELFYNVSYFNLLSIFVVVASLLFFVFDSRIAHIVNDICATGLAKAYRPEIEVVSSFLKSGLCYLYRIFLYYLVIDSLYSFTRIIGRLNYYFQKKISLQNEE